jgi:hypothetical protein
MTCVWDSLISSLELKCTPHVFLAHVKDNLLPPVDVMYNKERLCERLLTEMYDAIANVTVEDGYMCSTVDPLFFAVSQVFRVNVYVEFMGVMCSYEFVSSSTDGVSEEAKSCRLVADRNHMSSI